MYICTCITYMYTLRNRYSTKISHAIYYVFYITTTPYLPCNNKNINRKELYDFYYTAITLTTGYKCTYSLVNVATSH